MWVGHLSQSLRHTMNEMISFTIHHQLGILTSIQPSLATSIDSNKYSLDPVIEIL